ncbi:MAG TPA: hypothetical protein VJW51_11170, partial [Candidatus Acidoferrales bacterium]|nr:hypothetical protein [Candidatus Acidoferrales bacterium]
MEKPLNLSGPRPEAIPSSRGPELLTLEEHWGGSFYSRLMEFLTERPVRLPAGRGRLPFTPESPRTDFLDNLKTAMSAEPRITRGAESSPLLIHWGSSWGIFLQNVRDLISPPKLPPLKVTSAPGPP